VRFTQPRVFVPTLGLLAGMCGALALTAISATRGSGGDPPTARAERFAPGEAQRAGGVDVAPASATLRASAPPPDPPVARPDAASAGSTTAEMVTLAWELTDDSTHFFDRRVGDLLPRRRALNLDPSRLRELRAGDALALALPKIGTVEATVERVTRGGSGEMSLFAGLDGLGETSMLVLTIGRNALFGTVTTPGGNYQIEGFGGAGAIFEDHLDDLGGHDTEGTS
jgi:hypothetical protein